MGTTTKITSLFDRDAQALMADISYSVYSYGIKPRIKQESVNTILHSLYLQKLNRYYDCIAKAKWIATHLGLADIHLGSLMVDSTEKGVAYGYAYNPPLELHAWVQVGSYIIDFALAGTIEKGLNTKDEYGPFLVGRTPVVLAGTPAPWMHYQTYEIVDIDDVTIMDTEKAKSYLRNKRDGNRS